MHPTRDEYVEDLMETMQVPVNLTLEAARHVVRSAYWPEFEKIIERSLQLVPEARAVSVWLDPPLLAAATPKVLICLEVESPPRPLGEDNDPRELELDNWLELTFPKEIVGMFVFMILFGCRDDEG